MMTKESHSANLIADLRASELEYFKAGAECHTILHGEFSRLKGYEDIASGVVLHDIDFDGIDCNLSAWCRDAEKLFVDACASESRFYFRNGNHSDISSQLEGYKQTVEVGLILSLVSYQPETDGRSGELLKIDSDEHQAMKADLYLQSVIGPDGHNMKQGKFATFEQVKNKLKYMDSYLFWVDGRPIAAVSLAIKGDFGRLKNLLVHPDFRHKGMGRETVLQLIKKARELHCRAFGVYAEKDTPAHKMYQSCGLCDALVQYEYSKSLLKNDHQ